jgi:hypothetical protein
MSISFPLSAPSTPKPSSIRWTEVNVVGSALSQYTLQKQIYDWGGDAWQIDVEFDPLTREEASPWIAFLSALRGQNGTFLFGSTLFATPLGTAAGSPLLKGASQEGLLTITTDGWSISSAVLKAGDMFAIDYNLYRSLTNVTSNGSGEATLEIFPRLRSHADDSPLIVSNPLGTFRLTDNAIITQDESRTGLFNISFSAIEARS